MWLHTKFVFKSLNQYIHDWYIWCAKQADHQDTFHVTNKLIIMHFPPPPQHSHNLSTPAGSAAPIQPRLSGASSVASTSRWCQIWVRPELEETWICIMSLSVLLLCSVLWLSFESVPLLMYYLYSIVWLRYCSRFFSLAVIVLLIMWVACGSVIRRVCMASWLLSVRLSLCGKALTLCLHFSARFFYACMPTSVQALWSLPVYTTFIDRELGWEFARPAQSRTCWLHFLAQLSTEQDERWCVEAIQVEHPYCTCGDIYWMKGSDCCFTDCIKNFNVGMLSNI